MSSVAVIACSNGLGHVRRALLLCEALLGVGIAPTLLAPQASIARLQQTLRRDFSGVTLMDFDTGTSAQALRAGDRFATRWVERLPELDAYDLVLSDNLPEVLERYPDAVLSGSFFWHLELRDVPATFFDNAERLLRRHHPLMLTSRLFATPGLEQRVTMMPVGLFAAFPRPGTIGQDLLVSSGRGGDGAKALFVPVIEALLRNGKGAFDRVWIEPGLLPSGTPDWMAAAQFDSAMYRNLKAVICRPGLGTISDALVAGARIFSLYEPGNGELEFNAGRIVRMGAGDAVFSPSEARASALAFAVSQEAQARHWTAIQAVSGGGAEEAAAILSAHVKGRGR